MGSITRMMERCTPQQLFQLVREMKRLAVYQPDEARTLLTSEPQLAFAISQVCAVCV